MNDEFVFSLHQRFAQVRDELATHADKARAVLDRHARQQPRSAEAQHLLIPLRTGRPFADEDIHRTSDAIDALAAPEHERQAVRRTYEALVYQRVMAGISSLDDPRALMSARSVLGDCRFDLLGQAVDAAFDEIVFNAAIRQTIVSTSLHLPRR